MKKAWKIFGAAALICLIIGIGMIAAGFFMGSSPVLLRQRGSLDEYLLRLAANRDIFLTDLRSLLG